MGIYKCTECSPTKDFPKPGTAFRMTVDKRGFVMSIQCCLCGATTSKLNFKKTIDKRFNKIGDGPIEDNNGNQIG